LRVAAIVRFETGIATTANGSTGRITVDSNRNFIISDNVSTLEGRVETTVRESVNFKSKHNFNVNANTDIYGRSNRIIDVHTFPGLSKAE
jgi:hypothetical protein